MGLGWFGLSTFWLLPLVWRTVGRVLAGDRRLFGRGSLRVWMGTVLVLGASATLEALTGGEGDTAGGAVGHALAGTASGMLGWTGALLMMLAVLGLAAPMWLTAAPYLRANGGDPALPAFGYLKPVIRRAVLGNRRYDPALRIGEDYDLVLRLLIGGARFLLLPDPLYAYRRHAGSISHRLSVGTARAMLAAHRALPPLADPEARAWLDAELPARAAQEHDPTYAIFHNRTHDEERALIDAARAWQARRVDAGFGAITWGPDWGGPGLTAGHERVYVNLERGYQAPDRHENVLVTVELVAPTLHALGTDEQRERFVRPFLRADELCCQLFSDRISRIPMSRNGYPASSATPSRSTSVINSGAVNRIRPSRYVTFLASCPGARSSASAARKASAAPATT